MPWKFVEIEINAHIMRKAKTKRFFALIFVSNVFLLINFLKCFYKLQNTISKLCFKLSFDGGKKTRWTRTAEEKSSEK